MRFDHFRYDEMSKPILDQGPLPLHAAPQLEPARPTTPKPNSPDDVREPRPPLGPPLRHPFQTIRSHNRRPNFISLDASAADFFADPVQTPPRTLRHPRNLANPRLAYARLEAQKLLDAHGSRYLYQNAASPTAFGGKPLTNAVKSELAKLIAREGEVDVSSCLEDFGLQHPDDELRAALAEAADKARNEAIALRSQNREDLHYKLATGALQVKEPVGVAMARLMIEEGETEQIEDIVYLNIGNQAKRFELAQLMLASNRNWLLGIADHALGTPEGSDGGSLPDERESQLNLFALSEDQYFSIAAQLAGEDPALFLANKCWDKCNVTDAGKLLDVFAILADKGADVLEPLASIITDREEQGLPPLGETAKLEPLFMRAVRNYLDGDANKLPGMDSDDVISQFGAMLFKDDHGAMARNVIAAYGLLPAAELEHILPEIIDDGLSMVPAGKDRSDAFHALVDTIGKLPGGSREGLLTGLCGNIGELGPGADHAGAIRAMLAAIADLPVESQPRSLTALWDQLEALPGVLGNPQIFHSLLAVTEKLPHGQRPKALTDLLNNIPRLPDEGARLAAFDAVSDSAEKLLDGNQAAIAALICKNIAQLPPGPLLTKAQDKAIGYIDAMLDSRGAAPWNTLPLAALVPLQEQVARKLEQRFRDEMQALDQKQFDGNQPVHRLVSYLRLLRSPDAAKFLMLNPGFNLGNAEEIMRNGPEARDALVQQVGDINSAEVGFLSFEALLLDQFLDSAQRKAAELGVPLMVVPNLTYGGTAVAPLKLGKRPEIDLFPTKQGSTDAHDNPNVLNPNLFPPEQLAHLIEQRPLIVVVDGSKNERHPDGFRGYRNLLDLVNARQGMDTHGEWTQSGLDDGRFAPGDQHFSLVAQIEALAKSDRAKEALQRHGKGFELHYASLTKENLGTTFGEQPAEFAWNKVKGPGIVCVQSAVPHADILAEQNKPANKHALEHARGVNAQGGNSDTHTAAAFDDIDVAQNPVAYMSANGAGLKLGSPVRKASQRFYKTLPKD